jgi:hypothetical protein
MLIEQHSKGQDEFRTTLESLISVASRAAAIFERSPFDLMVNRRSYASWLGD